MKLEVSIKEIQDYINDQYRVDIDLKVVSEKKIEIDYFDSVLLIIDEVKENVIFLHYELNGLAVILVKVARIFLKRKPAALLVDWNPKTKEVILDLTMFPKLTGVLQFITVSGVQFLNDSIQVVFFARNKI